MSLVLTRKDNESVVIDGNIKVTVVETKVGSAKLVFDAPDVIDIFREELLDDSSLPKKTSDH